jgi:hypothetical protein
MDRRQIAYLLILLFGLALAVMIGRARYYSRTMVVRRRKQADQKRVAGRQQQRDGGL